MLMVMYAADGIGLAAPQVGINQRLMVFNEMVGWLLLYTVDFLFNVEWCIRQLLRSSITSYNITSIAHNHRTDIYPL